jgi:nitrile hydratase accessory protein
MREAPPELPELSGLPRDAGTPVFNEPWEARAFAMTLALHERGLFTWPQWAAALSREISKAQASGDADLGDTYYQHWLRALESLVKGLPAASGAPPLKKPI